MNIAVITGFTLITNQEKRFTLSGDAASVGFWQPAERFLFELVFGHGLMRTLLIY